MTTQCINKFFKKVTQNRQNTRPGETHLHVFTIIFLTDLGQIHKYLEESSVLEYVVKTQEHDDCSKDDIPSNARSSVFLEQS